MDIAQQFVIDISAVVMGSRLTIFLYFFYFILFHLFIYFERRLIRKWVTQNYQTFKCSEGLNGIFSLRNCVASRERYLMINTNCEPCLAYSDYFLFEKVYTVRRETV